MLKNKNIKFNLNDIDESDILRLTKYCEWHKCEEKGKYRAPSSRDKLREFKWFCLEHVKIYNKGWDYFKGRSSEEIYDELSEDARWHRETRKKVKQYKFSHDFFVYDDQEKRVFKEGGKNSSLIRQALEILNMDMPKNLNDLKKQYKTMVKKFHPDLNELKDKEKIIKLNESYSILLEFFKS